jgi:hypothetical protein
VAMIVPLAGACVPRSSAGVELYARIWQWAIQKPAVACLATVRPDELEN